MALRVWYVSHDDPCPPRGIPWDVAAHVLAESASRAESLWRAHARTRTAATIDDAGECVRWVESVELDVMRVRHPQVL
jgi:hypothetical protein